MQARPGLEARPSPCRRLAAVLGVLVLPGCSLILDFNFDDEPSALDASVACSAYEEGTGNASRQFAPVIDGTATAALCMPDLDFYKFTIDDRDDLELRVTYQNGPLDIEVWRSGDVLSAIQNDGGATEAVVIRRELDGNELEPGVYEFQVKPPDAAVDGEIYEYTVTVSIISNIDSDAGI